MPRFAQLLGDGARWGVSISRTRCSRRPRASRRRSSSAREFVGGDPSALVLGDNIFYGHDLHSQLARASAKSEGATVFAYPVADPERYGVVEFDAAGRVLSLEEKPAKPRSRYAVTGLYFYDNRVLDIARDLKPSARGELEITDVNRAYLARRQLSVRGHGPRDGVARHGHARVAPRGRATSSQTIEERQGLKIACLEEIAWRMGYIDDAAFERLGAALAKSGYGQYLLDLLRDGTLE